MFRGGNNPQMAVFRCVEVCSTNFLQVCGYDGKNYKNSCHALCYGVKVDYEGPCNSATLDCFKCKGTYGSPVCGDDNLNYPNACAATCSGMGILKNQCCCDTDLEVNDEFIAQIIALPGAPTVDDLFGIIHGSFSERNRCIQSCA